MTPEIWAMFQAEAAAGCPRAHKFYCHPSSGLPLAQRLRNLIALKRAQEPSPLSWARCLIHYTHRTRVLELHDAIPEDQYVFGMLASALPPLEDLYPPRWIPLATKDYHRAVAFARIYDEMRASARAAVREWLLCARRLGPQGSGCAVMCKDMVRMVGTWVWHTRRYGFGKQQRMDQFLVKRKRQ